MKNKRIGAVILAAGKGTRMQSELAKVLHPICGRTMLAYSVELAKEIGADRIAAVIGHQAERVREACPEQGVIFVEQQWQLGTGHAVLQAREAFAVGRGCRESGPREPHAWWAWRIRIQTRTRREFRCRDCPAPPSIASPRADRALAVSFGRAHCFRLRGVTGHPQASDGLRPWRFLVLSCL